MMPRKPESPVAVTRTARLPVPSLHGNLHRLMALLSLVSLCLILPVHAGSAGSSSAGDWTYGLGPNNDMYTSGWRQAGTGTRTWNAAADSFTFVWSGGDQIGRIGKNSSSSSALRAVKIKDVRASCMMSTTAEMKSLNTNGGSWYAFGVYGWTGPTANQHNEFYIDFQTSFNTSPGQNGYASIGSVTVDGIQFNCVKNMAMSWSPSQNQWRAECVSGTWSGAYKSAPWKGNVSIDIKKIFDYWISQGYPGDEYMNDLTWAIESFGGCTGNVVMSNIVVPNVSPATKAMFKPAAPVMYPTLASALFSLNGRILPTSLDARTGILSPAATVAVSQTTKGTALRISRQE
jgi:hypothetical protein